VRARKHVGNRLVGHRSSEDNLEEKKGGEKMRMLDADVNDAQARQSTN